MMHMHIAPGQCIIHQIHTTHYLVKDKYQLHASIYAFVHSLSAQTHTHHIKGRKLQSQQLADENTTSMLHWWAYGIESAQCSCSAVVAPLTTVQLFSLSVLILPLQLFLHPVPELPIGSGAKTTITTTTIKPQHWATSHSSWGLKASLSYYT